MAEFIMKKEIEEHGVAASFEVASAGTSDEEEGNPVYPPARAELSRRGIDCSGKRARKISRADCAHFDYILCMEDWHVRSVLRLCGEKEKGKVHRLSDYTDRPHDIGHRRPVVHPRFCRRLRRHPRRRCRLFNQVKINRTRPERRLLRALGLILIAIPLWVLLLRLSPQSIAKCALSGCKAIASG